MKRRTMPSDKDTWLLKYSIVTYILLVCIANDAITEALHCYSCGWSSDAKKCKEKSKVKITEDLLFPLPERCIPGTRTPSAEDLAERGCRKIECDNVKPACLKWSFLASGSVENITWACVGNRDNRNGKYEVDWSKKDDSDKKKKLNEKTYKVEVVVCNEDYCNGAVRHPIPSSMFVWTFLLLLCYSSFFVNK